MWLEIDFPDIDMCLISRPVKHTKQSLKSYKSLDAWSYFKARFVEEITAERSLSISLTRECSVLSSTYYYNYLVVSVAEPYSTFMACLWLPCFGYKSTQHLVGDAFLLLLAIAGIPLPASRSRVVNIKHV